MPPVADEVAFFERIPAEITVQMRRVLAHGATRKQEQQSLVMLQGTNACGKQRQTLGEALGALSAGLSSPEGTR
jgi:hypothetical protein